MNGEQLDALLDKARALENKGDLPGAAAALDTAPDAAKARGVWRYARGSIAFRQGQLDDAQKLFEKAVEAEPELAEYRSNLGAVLLERARQGDTAAAAKALEVLKEATRWGVTLPDVYVNYALALLLSGRNDEALKACDDALAIDAAHVPARYNRAAALSALGRDREALEALDAILRAHPAHPQATASRKRLSERVGRA